MTAERFKIVSLHWIGALVKSVVQGTALSLKAFFAAGAGSAATNGAIPAMSLKTAGAVALSAAILSAVDFLSKNPVPDEDDEPEPISTSNIEHPTTNIQ